MKRAHLIFWSALSLGQAAAGAAAPPGEAVEFYNAISHEFFVAASGSEALALDDEGIVYGWMRTGRSFDLMGADSTTGECAAGSVALMRLGNTGLCASLKSGPANANLLSTASTASLAGTWSGDARWRSEANDVESESRHPLELTIAADATLSGSGNGCTFAGMLDASRPLAGSTITATGCNEAAFNGDYRRLRIERFGPNALVARLRKASHDSEASIWARLANAAAPPPPAVPGVAFIAGDWSGMVAWQAGSHAQLGIDVNRTLSLTISSTGAVSGSGFGCTLTGVLAGNPANRSGFSGSMSAAGCEDARFNGAFGEVRVRIERAGARLEVRFQRESADVEVEIEGPLEANHGGAPPPAPPVSVALTGAWHGNVAWLATRRGASGDTVVLGSALEAIAFSIASDGAFSGSGFGCTFAGHLTLASEGRAVSGGEITASGCANAAFNGSYASPSLHRDDGQLEVELEREESTASGVVKVKIAGKVMR